MMHAVDVLEFVELAAAANIEVWLDGGWCVDALVGEQTRAHDDLDVAVPVEHTDALHALMTTAGFALHTDDALNPVFADEKDHRIDVHYFDRSIARVNDEGREVFGGIAYTVDAFGATGTIDKQPVPCCTPDFLMYAHTCYEPDANDFVDMRVLHERLGTPLLPPFTLR